ncbi:unnamed protein product [Rotaria sordida]|uniref:Protein zer-1 homolog-like C-terminal domain-containing protein n=1 Tax=Rotaria sordida TaxID=392033 RepID=A0A815D221_9BILA|nr:unnamed protein product [Rotaria sordida]CAF1567499.1 unnamed protein product [Rotaria sordida]
MVDNPDKLCTICLRKFSSLLKSDQLIWKKQLEEQVDKVYCEEKQQAKLNLTEQQKRKHHRGESCRIDEELPIQIINNSYDKIIFHHNQKLFIEYFLRGYCPLNSILSEHLVNYLTTHDQLNDFTLSLFSSNATCLKRFVINVKYLSRLQCHILNQHPNIIELDIIFKDSNSNRTINMTNEMFYQHICPSIYSKFDEIYTLYGPFILHHIHSRIQTESRRSSISNNSLLQNLPNSSDEFSHHKLLNGIFNNLHPMTIERLKILSLSHYKFFTASHSTAARKYSLGDMSPLTKCSTNSSSPSSSTMSIPVNFIPINLRLLLKFTNLTSLNLSSTDIKNPCIDMIIDSLQNLDTFDLSLCRSIKLFNSLLKLSSKLKWLNLYNCCFHMQQNPSIYHILYQLKYLEYLDISNDNTFNDNNNNNTSTIIDSENDINKFLREDNCLPRLKHFDISGQKTISSISLYHFLLKHKNLQFLGLFLTNEKYSSCLFDKNDLCYSKYRHYTYDLHHIQTVTLTENDITLYEPYLIEALTRYRDRSGFVQKILFYIFFLTRSFHSKQQNLLIELILHVMSTHSNLQPVQMASTACIYNLTRTPITEQIHIKYLAQIVQATMNVMATFPNHQQLQKNCLLTLCSDRILHEPHFNFYLLATLVMHNLLHYTDLAIIQPGVAILSLLTTRLTIDECTQLGSITNLKRLLQLIEQQIERLQTIQINQNQQAHNVHNDQTQQTLSDIDITLNHTQQLTSDDTLRFCLSLLWNLTDENAIVCENFIQSMGLQLFQRLLHLFSTDTIVLTKIVGLLSNIAEVSHLKIFLYSIDIIPLMQKYITEAILDVAFSAIGILAHLLYEQTDDEINLELCQQMRETIVSWQNPHTNMVTYRSFKPFLPLLHCTRLPVVQLWAVWAIHHVCSTDRARYSRIVREEKTYEIMQKLYDDQLLSEYPDPLMIQLLKSTLHLLKSYHSNRHQHSSAVAS